MAKFSYETMAQVEDYILEQLGLFVNDVTGLDVFLMDQPWPMNTTPSLGIGIIDYRDSGGWGDTTSATDDRFDAVLDLRITVEFFAKSGRPMANLALLIQALRGFQEERYQRLYSKGIGFLSVGNAVPANTVFDGAETEKRARVTAIFNVCIKSRDIVKTTPVETITGSIFTNVPAGSSETTEIQIGFDEIYNFYNGPLEGSKEVQEKLKRGLTTAVSQTFNVEFKTT